MPPAKTLEQLVRGRSFRARRHGQLLLGRRLPWPELAELQERYRHAAGELEGRQIAVEFERAVRDRRAVDDPPFPIILYVACGPGQAQIDWCRAEDGTVDLEAYDELGRAWDEWNDEHGLAWCARNLPAAIGNRIRAIAQALGEPSHDLRELDARRADLLERFNRKTGRRRIPDPPGWEHIQTLSPPSVPVA